MIKDRLRRLQNLVSQIGAGETKIINIQPIWGRFAQLGDGDQGVFA